MQNDVEKVVVVILDKEHRPVEKFVFEITQPPLLSTGALPCSPSTGSLAIPLL